MLGAIQHQLAKAADTVKDAVLPSKNEHDTDTAQDVDQRQLAPAGYNDSENATNATTPEEEAQIASDFSKAPPAAAGRDDAAAAAIQHEDSSPFPAAVVDASSNRGPESGPVEDQNQAQYITIEKTDTDDAAVTKRDDTPAVQEAQRKGSVRSFALADAEARTVTDAADSAHSQVNQSAASAGAVPLPKTRRTWMKTPTAWYPDSAGINRPPG
eukprot:gene2589-2891_t